MNRAATHLWTADTDCHEESSPFTGLTVTLLERTGYNRAGFNALVLLHCTPAQLVNRYEDCRYAGPRYSEGQMVEWHSCDDYPGALVVEVDTDDLTEVV